MTQIDEFILRVPGLDAAQSTTLGNDVAQLVAASLPEGIGTQHVPEVNIRLTEAQLNSGGSMAASIADQIVKQLKMAMHTK